MSPLSPRSPDAAIIAEMGWVLMLGGAAVLAIVVAFAAYAVLAPRERAARLTGRAFIVGGGIVFPSVTLAALLVYSLVRASALSSAGSGPALRIEVTGEQWWWRVHYLDDQGRVDLVTANEIHIPVGRPVDLTLRSADVIHSFWVPALAGKLDMIPGKANRLRISASDAGRYRGQCAEYCGGPHALMAFFVVAQPEGEFAAWAARQRAAANSTGAGQAPGAALFEASCAACHAIRGTRAAGSRGPDLTHLASRETIGAGRLPRNAGTIAAWIASSQQLKPGNLMPDFAHLSGAELQALAGYLESLE